ncbi:chromosome transmission fidelity protein 18 [Exophiala viscosa]|uniref:chromosome transmission fidelity protein 18 n=1 Tax=Exophiala viscosa TaxID=2486360 RepID=UPI00219DDDB7|nr:chromosome transmission fidelity protein 18 [Exophiala viscosa]
MFRPAATTVLRSAAQSSFAPARTTAGKRFASTSRVNARRSWKSSALRWGVAIAGIYYYNTSPVFAEQPQHNLLNPNLEALDDSVETTSLEELTSRRARQAERNTSVLKSAAETVSSENASTSVSAQQESHEHAASPQELEEEAASEGAFNPETGEINWDCPCLGGMAHGPCGTEFREAFSCFVFSNEEPKGMDCIDKFQGMQQCFQRHPEVYKGELEDDAELDAELEAERQELVGQIAERKAADQQQSAPQHRLLEEPEPATSRPSKSSKKPAPKSEEKPARPQEKQVQGKTETQHVASSKPPQEEAKVKVHDDETLSPERENITEGQKSKPISEPQDKSVDKAATPTTEVLPAAAHDARGQTGVVNRDTEDKTL